MAKAGGYCIGGWYGKNHTGEFSYRRSVVRDPGQCGTAPSLVASDLAAGVYDRLQGQGISNLPLYDKVRGATARSTPETRYS